MSAGSNDEHSHASSSAGPNGDDSSAREQILSVIREFWAAMDRRDADAAAALVAAGAVFIDAFAPHIWTGENACQAWLHDLWAFCAKENIVVGSTALRDPSRYSVTGNHAYVVSPAIMASARGRDLMSQGGVITMTLAREGDHWRVTGMCWAGQ